MHLVGISRRVILFLHTHTHTHTHTHVSFTHVAGWKRFDKSISALQRFPIPPPHFYWSNFSAVVFIFATLKIDGISFWIVSAILYFRRAVLIKKGILKHFNRYVTLTADYSHTPSPLSLFLPISPAAKIIVSCLGTVSPYTHTGEILRRFSLGVVKDF